MISCTALSLCFKSKEEIANISGLPLDEVEKLKANKTAK